jgi:2-C-methyl-D-erythritol 2,4-cyclodiphosphate synthase
MPIACPYRVGLGHDIHRLQPGGRLMVSGVCVSQEMSAVAHSDGDVVLHALVDALLGAAGAGDIGERFPNSDPQWRGVDSSRFVIDVLSLLASRKMSIVNIDVMILAERPKLSPFKSTMRQRLMDLTGCPSVSLKAGTNEQCDAVGRGEAIAAQVVALLSLDE